MKTVKRGFTLIELLTVVSIIILLIGILVPAVSQARKKAMAAAVKAQLYGMSQGLEMFKSDFGYYPSSKPQPTSPAYPGYIADDRSDYDNGTHIVQGSHRLAFALLGRDKLGCPAKAGSSNSSVQVPDGFWGAYYTDGLTNAAEHGKFTSVNILPDDSKWGDPTYKTVRKGPYIDPKGFNIILDNSSSDTYFSKGYVWLLSDRYDKQGSENIMNENDYSNHSPILYYCANEKGTRINTYRLSGIAPSQNIYYPQDNSRIATVFGNFKGDYVKSGDDYTESVFWTLIEDKKAAIGSVQRPYNPESFLLISKGWDGEYGTDDDVTNWQ